MYFSEVKITELRKLLIYLQQNNYYYSKILSNLDLGSTDFELLRQFQNIPIFTKELILDIGDDYYSCSKEENIYEWTSGTSGQPFKVIKTQKERMSLAIFQWKEEKDGIHQLIQNPFFH